MDPGLVPDCREHRLRVSAARAAGPGSSSRAPRNVEDGLTILCVHHIQSHCSAPPWVDLHSADSDLPPLPDPMERDPLGHLPSCRQMETYTDRHPPVDYQHIVDDCVHRHMEAVMDELKWEVLTEVQGRLE